jgi:hypothetical protein
MRLTDIVGERIITVLAVVTIDGTDYTATRDVSFGNGPLSVFNAPVGTTSPMTWGEAYQACNASVYTGNPSGWSYGDYVGGPKMPTRAEYLAVSPSSSPNPNTAAQGAAFAAGWPENLYWANDAIGPDDAFLRL